MILKANTRGNARALGRHLLNERDNDHVEVHDVRGFASRDVMEAMREHDGIAASCRSKQTLFSVSLNPPKEKSVDIGVFEDAITRIEERNNLAGQPRIVIFHEKDGRRHCHAAWSRIDPENLTVKPLPFYKMKCKELALEIHVEQNWPLPRGFIDKRERDPRSFDLAEWQQAKRIGRDPRQLKTLAQESWGVVKGDPAAFARALEERGLYLARGDRRSHVALTVEGEPFSVAKLLGIRAKEVRARLGEGDDLRGIEATRAHIADAIMPKLRALMQRADTERDAGLAPLDARREAMKAQHRTERQLTDAGIAARTQAENAERASRLRSGLAGLWDRLRGERQRVQAQIEAERWQSLQRDRAHRAALIAAQLADRAALQREIVAVRQAHAATLLELHRDLARQQGAREQLREATLRPVFQPAHDAEDRRVALRALTERPAQRPAPQTIVTPQRGRDLGRDFER